MKKRFFCFLLALLLLGLAACQDLGKKPITLQNKMPIPEDGVIAASVLESLQKQNKVVTFYGESNGVSYEWTVFGSDIEEIRDLNFAVEILQATKEKVAFRYFSLEDFGFSPVLSLCLKEAWSSNSATVYNVSNGAAQPQCSASVTGSKEESILNFSPASQTGSFEIRADETVNTLLAQTEPPSEPTATVPMETDPYLSGVSSESGRILSDGSKTGQDAYKTDPVPEGKPMPVEPDDQVVDNQKAFTCTFSIECTSILNHLGDLEPDKLDELPSDGIIFPAQSVTFYAGESVFDVLQRVCKENGIQMEATWTPMYNSAYIEGVHNLYEFDCGSGSGWMYSVNGWYPNYGCSRYQLAQGEIVCWRYTCDLGSDIGGGNALG